MAPRIQPVPEVEVVDPGGRISMIVEADASALAHRDDADIGRRIGGHGQEFRAGEFVDEHTPDLDTRDERIDAYDKIRRGVSAVHSALAKIRTPIIQAQHAIDAGEPLPPLPSQEPEELTPELADRAELAARLYRANLFGEISAYRMRTSWRQYLGEVLSALWAGISMHEVVYGLREGPLGEWVVVEHLAWIHPRSIERMVFDADEDFIGITQKYRKTWHEDPENPRPVERTEDVEVFIPANKLVVWAPEPEGANPEGLSLIRPMYGDVKELVTLRRTNVVHAIRTAYAIPQFKFTEDGPQITQDRKDAATRTAKRLRGGAPENSFIVLMPGEEVEYLEGGRTAFDPTEMMRQRERAIRSVVSAEASGLGQGGEGGSRAVGEVQEISKRLHVQAIASSLAETVRSRIIEPLHRINFPEDVPLPSYEIGNIFPPDLDAIKAGVDAKVLTPDEGLEDWFRDALGLPARPQEEPEEEDNEPPPPPPPPQAEDETETEDEEPTDGPDDPATMAERPTPPERMQPNAADVIGVPPEALSREPTEYERTRVPLAEINRGFDAAGTDFEAAVRREWEAVVDEIVASASVDESGFPELTRPSGDGIREAMERLAEEMRQRGQETLRKELLSQLEAIGLRERVELAELPGFTEEIDRLSASATSVRAGSRVETRIKVDLVKILDETMVSLREAILASQNDGLGPEDAIKEAGRRVTASGTADRGKFKKLITDAGRLQASSAFAQGRAEAAAAGREALDTTPQVAIEEARRTSVLDGNTCDACRELDQVTVRLDTEQYWELMPPARCEGGERCRCFYVYEIDQ